MNCKRCGDCCHLSRVWKNGRLINSDPCPFLSFKDEIAFCEIHDKKPEACRRYFCEAHPLTPNKEWNNSGVKAFLRSYKEDNKDGHI